MRSDLLEHVRLPKHNDHSATLAYCYYIGKPMDAQAMTYVVEGPIDLLYSERNMLSIKGALQLTENWNNIY